MISEVGISGRGMEMTWRDGMLWGSGLNGGEDQLVDVQLISVGLSGAIVGLADFLVDLEDQS